MVEDISEPSLVLRACLFALYIGVWRGISLVCRGFGLCGIACFWPVNYPAHTCLFSGKYLYFLCLWPFAFIGDVQQNFLTFG